MLYLDCERQRVGYVPKRSILEREETPINHRLVPNPDDAALALTLSKELDRIGLDGMASNRAAKAALREWNDEHPSDQIHIASDVLAAVIRSRKARNASRNVPETPDP
jgi:hypothetical protein